MSEMVGYDGPIYMTHPTKAICPILLEDFRKITVDKKGETNFFTSQMIKDCMKKVVPLNLHQTVQVSVAAVTMATEAARGSARLLSPPAGGRRVGDQSVLRRSRPGSCDGPHQSGLGVRGLHREWTLLPADPHICIHEHYFYSLHLMFLICFNLNLFYLFVRCQSIGG